MHIPKGYPLASFLEERITVHLKKVCPEDGRQPNKIHSRYPTTGSATKDSPEESGPSWWEEALDVGWGVPPCGAPTKRWVLLAIAVLFRAPPSGITDSPVSAPVVLRRRFSAARRRRRRSALPNRTA